MAKFKDSKLYNKIPKRFRNKYVLTLIVFAVYGLIIDDNDVVSLVSYNVRLSKLNNELESSEQKLKDTKNMLHDLNNEESLEKYAREKKFFKKADEDVFVITYQ